MTVREFSNNSSSINLVFISGGPGLSSVSFNGLMPLKENYSLHFIEAMGTISPLEKEPTYENLIAEIREVISCLENVILCGHSFGGIQAIDIASDGLENIKGLIVIASPVSKNAFRILGENFATEITEEQDQISDLLESEPTDDVYKEWFYKHRDFYFNPERSNDLISVIMEDSVCVKSYSKAIVESSQKENKLRQIKNIRIPKLFISGDLDKVVPPESAKYESSLGEFKLEVVEGAAHFVHHECPEKVIKIINNFLPRKGE